MAVERTPQTSRLQLQLQTGVDPDTHEPILSNRYFNNVKPAAADENVYEAAQVLVGLQKYELQEVRRIDTGSLFGL
ncbi:MAG TPA: DUF1659 domain-containing protein [bacterium]|jgi:hypothetical protein|nr:DUF1659 domain-containing protein [bacterium]